MMMPCLSTRHAQYKALKSLHLRDFLVLSQWQYVTVHASRWRSTASTAVQVQPLLNLCGIPFLACSTATPRKLPWSFTWSPCSPLRKPYVCHQLVQGVRFIIQCQDSRASPLLSVFVQKCRMLHPKDNNNNNYNNPLL